MAAHSPRTCDHIFSTLNCFHVTMSTIQASLPFLSDLVVDIFRHFVVVNQGISLAASMHRCSASNATKNPIQYPTRHLLRSVGRSKPRQAYQLVAAKPSHCLLRLKSGSHAYSGSDPEDSCLLSRPTNKGSHRVKKQCSYLTESKKLPHNTPSPDATRTNSCSGRPLNKFARREAAFA
jgi:hypothetical protein